jgi:hypothetical membrane protein
MMPQEKKHKRQFIGALIGLAVPILAFTCIFIAISSYPAFSWTHNALSDLGVVPGMTSQTFNFGLFASGFLGFTFAITGLFNYFDDNRVGKAGALTFAAATLALMSIGIFNEDFRPTHFIVSVLFFAILPIALWVITAGLYFKRETKLAVFTVAASIAAATPWILYYTIHYVPNVAIPEFISSMAGSIWLVVICLKMLKENIHKPQSNLPADAESTNIRAQQ